MYSNGYNYNGYNTAATTAAAGVATGFGVFAVIMIILEVLLSLASIAIAVIGIIGEWKTFTKMGRQGYEALIPGHDYVVLLEKAGMPMWYFFLFLIPVAGTVFMIMMSIELAKKFGKSTGFGVLLGLLPAIGFAILGLSKDTKFKA